MARKCHKYGSQTNLWHDEDDALEHRQTEHMYRTKVKQPGKDNYEHRKTQNTISPTHITHIGSNNKQ